MNAAWSRGWRKAVRSLVQLAAGGALTGLVAALADGLTPTVQATVMAAWTALTALAMNTLEAAKVIPVLLPTQPIPPG